MQPEVFQFVDFLTYLNMRQVCRRWNTVGKLVKHPYVERCRTFLETAKNIPKRCLRREGWLHLAWKRKRTDVETVVLAHALHNMYLRRKQVMIPCKVYPCANSCYWNSVDDHCTGKEEVLFRKEVQVDNWLTALTLDSTHYIGLTE